MSIFLWFLDHVTLTSPQRSELGPYHNEKQMPQWLVKLLESDGEIKVVNKLDKSSGKYKKVRVCENMAVSIISSLNFLFRLKTRLPNVMTLSRQSNPLSGFS
jgi:hypothetical protein